MRDRGAGERNKRCRREGGNMPLPMGTLPLFKPTRIVRVSLKRRMRARSGEADAHLRGGGGGGESHLIGENDHVLRVRLPAESQQPAALRRTSESCSGSSAAVAA